MHQAALIVPYIGTSIPATIYGFRSAKMRREMEDALDWGKVGPGFLGRSLRNVPRQYAAEHPNDPLTRRYFLNIRVSLLLAFAFVIEVFILQ